MITNKNQASKGRLRESIRQICNRHSLARVTGEAFTSLTYAQFDLDGVVGDKWLELIEDYKTGYHHHPYQWACRQSIARDCNFAEIATENKCIELRASLELARLSSQLLNGSISRSPVIFIKDSLHQERESEDLINTTSPVVVEYGHLLMRHYRDLQPVVRTAFQIKAQMVTLKTEHYAAVTINLGDLLLNKHRGKTRAQLIKLMTDRIRDAQEAGKLPRMSMIFGLEMHPHPHLHILIFAHSEESLAPYEAALKSVGGKYDPAKKGAAAKTRDQLNIIEGYGFESALGWTNYARKQSPTLYEPRHIVQAGKALYLQARRHWYGIAATVEYA